MVGGRSGVHGVIAAPLVEVVPSGGYVNARVPCMEAKIVKVWQAVDNLVIHIFVQVYFITKQFSVFIVHRDYCLEWTRCL